MNAGIASSNPLVSSLLVGKKGGAGKSREELALEKQLELEQRLLDVSGQLNSGKKPQKTKGESE